METKKFTLAVIGCGRFADWFMPIFKAHPNVEKIYACDLVESKAKDFEKRFCVKRSKRP